MCFPGSVTKNLTPEFWKKSQFELKGRPGIIGKVIHIEKMKAISSFKLNKAPEARWHLSIVMHKRLEIGI